MSDDLDAQFTKAAADVQSLPKDPGSDVKLRLYGLFKQASDGDADGKRPGFTNPVGRAKYDAWDKNKGMSSEDAKHAYIAVVSGLIG